MTGAVIALSIAIGVALGGMIWAMVRQSRAVADEKAATRQQIEQEKQLIEAVRQRDAALAAEKAATDENARMREQLAETQRELNAARAEVLDRLRKDLIGAPAEDVLALLNKRLARPLLSESGPDALEKP